MLRELAHHPCLRAMRAQVLPRFAHAGADEHCTITEGSTGRGDDTRASAQRPSTALVLLFEGTEAALSE